MTALEIPVPRSLPVGTPPAGTPTIPDPPDLRALHLALVSTQSLVAAIRVELDHARPERWPGTLARMHALVDEADATAGEAARLAAAV